MDDICAVCRTDEGVTHQCPACGFEFCDAHADQSDHDCPAIDATSGEDSTGSGDGERDARDALATLTGTVAARGSAAVAEARAAASSVQAAIARRTRDAATSVRSAGSELRDWVADVRSRIADRASAVRSAPSEARRTGGDESGGDSPVRRARRSVAGAMERGRRGIERGRRRIASSMARVGTDGSPGRRRLATIGLVVVVLVATSAVVLGTSGLVTDGPSDGSSSEGPTNELVADGNGETAIESSAAFDEALLAEINDARDEEGVARLQTDDALAGIATDHSADMADAGNASLEAWDADRLTDRLDGTDSPCETVAQTGAWIDAGGESDAEALAETTTDRWMSDDEFRGFLLSSDYDRGAVASAVGDDGRRYVSITTCGT